MVHNVLTDTGFLNLGPPGGQDATEEGTWIIQVTAYAGLTGITPQVSVDGINWVTGAVVPSNSTTPGTPVITIAANGVYYFDCKGARARLVGVGVGSAVLDVMAATRG